MTTKAIRYLVYAVMPAVALCLTIASPAAYGANRYVDSANVCGGNTPCYLHPQDAVNAANPGDTILVYPGTYDSRFFQCPWQPNCGCSDNYSPSVIVYKDNLTIRSVAGAATTTIQATHVCWSNPIAVQNSTNGAIVGVSGWNPSPVVVIANNATIDGFTLKRPKTCANAQDCFSNTAGVFIGSKGAGYPDYLGNANGATVQNNVFTDVWHAVYIWHSSNNRILDNTVLALGDTGHWAAMESYDGYNDAQIAFGSPSNNNAFLRNAIADKGIGVGSWAPPTARADNSGDVIACNTGTSFGAFYDTGRVLFGFNTANPWTTAASNVLNVTGVSYTGVSQVIVGPTCTAPVPLSAQLAYSVVAPPGDGSGIPVWFSVNAGPRTTVNTSATGGAGISPVLGPGSYPVSTGVGDWLCPSAVQNVVVNVLDQSMPTVGLPSATPSMLWPADGSMVPVTVAITATDNCGVQCKITAVTTNEPTGGDAVALGEAVITGPLTVSLKAERFPASPSRVYGIVVTCMDPSGNAITKTVNVTVPFAQTVPSGTLNEGVYQVRYLSNLNVADSYVQLSNTGALDGNDPAGRLCANLYVFDPNEEPVSCCACQVTPNGLVSISARNDLIANPLTPGVPTSLVVKVVFTTATGGCNPGTLPITAPLPTAFPQLLAGMKFARGGVAWANTVHANTATSPASYQVTGTRFESAELSPTEYFKLVNVCNFIQTYASGFGLCRSCR